MNERWDTPETSVQIHRITKNGDDMDEQDVVAGLEVQPDGVLRIDLRNLRPIRINDRDNLIVELYLADVLRAVAVAVEREIKQ